MSDVTTGPGDTGEVSGAAAPGRAIEIEVTIEAPVEAVWEALSTGEGLARWFAPEAKVEPGAGGTVWLSWGGGMEGTGRIEVWEPNRRIAWSEGSGEPTAVPFLVDFHLEGKGGATKLRLVHSGFSASADWDEQYDSTRAGWTYFLFNLGFHLIHHPGRKRTMISARRRTTRPVAEVWRSLLRRAGVDASGIARGQPYSFELEGAQSGHVEYVREPRNLAGTLSTLDDGLLFIEMEPGTPAWHCGVWISVYGMEESGTARLQAALDSLMDAEFGAA